MNTGSEGNNGQFVHVLQPRLILLRLTILTVGVQVLLDHISRRMGSGSFKTFLNNILLVVPTLRNEKQKNLKGGKKSITGVTSNGFA